jgi:hypothetical protein
MPIMPVVTTKAAAATMPTGDKTGLDFVVWPDASVMLEITADFACLVFALPRSGFDFLAGWAWTFSAAARDAAKRALAR